MSDSAVLAEKALSFSEPPVLSSRDFLQVHTTERPAVPGQFYKDGGRFNISLRNISQNEYLDPNQIFLQFSVVVVNDTPGPSPILEATYRHLDVASAKGATAMFPGTPAFGCPFFSGVSVAVPGLGLESFLRTDVESQELVVSRLLCSGYPADARTEGLGRNGSYKILGKPYMAGARDVPARAECVFGKVHTSADPAGGLSLETLPREVAGTAIHYSVPLSLFSHLFNGLSSHLPLAYLSAGGDLLNMQFNLAPAATALCDNSGSSYFNRISGKSHFYIIDPCISYTKLQINNANILAGIEALYRGVAKLPIAPGVSAPMAMVLKSTDYSVSTTEIRSSDGSGRFSITIPCNEPSVRGVLLRFTMPALDIPVPGNTYQAAQWTGKHFTSIVPALRNLQLRIGSYRAPLDALSDSTVFNVGNDLTSVGISAAENKFTAANVSNNTSAIYIPSAHREVSRLYNMGKHLFSPFKVDDAPQSSDAMAPWYQYSQGRSDSAAGDLFHTGGQVIQRTESEWLATSVRSASDRTRWVDQMGVPMYLIPFEAFQQVLNDRESGFGLAGLDLRNITSLQISGEVTFGTPYTSVGISQAPENDVQPYAKVVPNVGYRVHAMMCYDRMMTLLPQLKKNFYAAKHNNERCFLLQGEDCRTEKVMSASRTCVVVGG